MKHTQDFGTAESHPVNVGVLNDKIVIFSHDAFFHLLKNGWYWGTRPSDEEIDNIVSRLEANSDSTFVADGVSLSRNRVLERLAFINAGVVKAALTNGDHLKYCFGSFVNNLNISEGKAELLMRSILHNSVENVSESAYNEIIQFKEKVNRDAEPPRAKKWSLGRLLSRVRHKLNNEFEPKYINGKLTVRKHGDKYQVIAHSTIDNDTIIVWDKSDYVVQSAQWVNNNDIVLYCGYGIVTLTGPRDHKNHGL